MKVKFLSLKKYTANLMGSSKYAAMPRSERHQFASLCISLWAAAASMLMSLT
jgi:hypothetical protein